jgi:hypothetical protein
MLKTKIVLMSFEVHTAITVMLKSCFFLRRVDLQVDADVSEKHAVSIFSG